MTHGLFVASGLCARCLPVTARLGHAPPLGVVAWPADEEYGCAKEATMDFSAQRDFAVRLGCQLAATLRLPIDEDDDRWIEAVKELTHKLIHQEAG